MLGRLATRLAAVVLLGATTASGQSLPDDPADTLQLRLNLPAFRLEVRGDTELARSFRVAVGMRKYQTPTGEFELTQIVWNPWWYPPDVEWARNEKITPPGPNNPMGKVKLLLQGRYYLHGTPFVSSMGRAASHGCIRLRNEDAIALARLVQQHTRAALTDTATDSLAGPNLESRTVTLPRPVRLTIVYELAEVRDSVLEIYPDIYAGRHGTTSVHVLATLARAGYDTTLVSPRALRKLIQRARRRRVSVAIAAVLRSSAAIATP